jgi:hypothetical protein
MVRVLVVYVNCNASAHPACPDSLLHGQALEVRVIDEDYDVHDRVDHCEITAKKPGSRNEKNQLLNHKSPLAFIEEPPRSKATSMPVWLARAGSV